MLPYRLQQVWNLFHRSPTDEARAWARAQLTAAQQALFFAQEPADQAHAIVVARALVAQGKTDPRLIRAALLHDAGKAPGISLPYRTAVILLKKVAPGWLSALSPDRRDWLAPLARAWHHPAIGAELAERAGCDPDTVALIAQHQRRDPDLPDELCPLHAALQVVDDAN